ncbi:MAG: LPS export ABC transporter periplasmic protein LptC [Candidatus Pacebacteria bacterium]|nr:LPS export ABC transporter periplasmic protein LptC [Candidatus Paceibacterota bacterium]
MPAPKKKLLIRHDLRFAQGGINLRQGLSRIGLHRALRRSIKIALWKRTLPFVALVIMVLLMSWPYLVPEEKKFRIEVQEAPKFEERNSRLNGMRYIGVDDQNQTYTITSTRAEQTDSKSNTVLLTNPVSDLRMKDRSWFYLSSNQGTLYNLEKRVEMTGKVSVFSSEGLEFHTESLNINLVYNDIDSSQPIKGQGPALSFEGEGMKVLYEGNLIKLLGRSQVTLRTAASESSDGQAMPFSSSP